MSPKPIVYINYGFCEGPRIGRRFAKALEAQGFEVTRQPSEATIIIGHSGGCLCVPKAANSQLTILIGVPYWPGKSLVQTLVQKNRAEYRIHRQDKTTSTWWRKFAWNSVYFWHMRKNWQMESAHLRDLQIPPSKQTVCIRNRNDTGCIETIWQSPALSQASFLSLPGEHDDLWLHPEGYAAIIKAYHGANVLAPPKS